ncbi:Hpt domain-containing protein, partial [Tahibacter caeni]|uniref:Hpt domain-containing protein n=1 Tax=Tahibacter caeni TaxID=1453545 RepID=UPI002148F6DF
ALEQALARGDRSAAGREAHRIKGAARLVGATELAEQAGLVEQELRGATTTSTPDLAPLQAALQALGRERT